MNERMERAISKMLLEVVRGISSKYGLEISEIKKEIGLDVKIVNERERKKKSERIMLPFCGIGYVYVGAVCAICVLIELRDTASEVTVNTEVTFTFVS